MADRSTARNMQWAYTCSSACRSYVIVFDRVSRLFWSNLMSPATVTESGVRGRASFTAAAT